MMNILVTKFCKFNENIQGKLSYLTECWDFSEQSLKVIVFTSEGETPNNFKLIMCIAAKSSVDGKEMSSKSVWNTNSDFIVPLKVPWDIRP